ncbi:KGK domain-containing protein [Trichormus variabilis]|uniref:KGK domain-containing protein n=1 Tax=Trichormus variabilis SAG 1403-4b TaxID=447716 RepID=A0A3S1C3J3_ANAVA|nr:KGK domain-containing protein [Trichormus variabilis]MBD2626466.1 KGK domain protein [Trichormus variabilis FACHB-164]RUS95989.1 hypothetical protein DSM107003_26510 [Trichormus variabilis SAG 1403-4b]
MEDNFEILDSEEGDIVIDCNGHILKVSQLDVALSKVILDKGSLNHLNHELKSINSRVLPDVKKPDDWINNGVACQILKPGKNWQTGKLRIKVNLEFCPDDPEIEQTTKSQEPESPLDDLRRMINDATS